MNYYTLFVNDNGRWVVAFGDYVISVVRQEAIDSYSDYARKDKRIICTSADQDAINEKFRELNA